MSQFFGYFIWNTFAKVNGKSFGQLDKNLLHVIIDELEYAQIRIKIGKNKSRIHETFVWKFMAHKCLF